MCLAIPGLVESIEGRTAIVDFGGVKREAIIDLMEPGSIVPGTYVLVHTGFVIQRMEKEEALERLVSKVDAPEVSTLDGVKIVYQDGSWVLFRPSGTEPIFRIYAESSSEETVKELIESHKKFVKNVVDELSAA